MNTKAKGSRRERQARAILEAAGYFVVKAGGSLGIFDLVALGLAGARLVQVKSRDWPGSAEMETLRDFPCPRLCRKLVHRWRDRQRVPDLKELT